jgi:hypothetical protein
MRTTRRQQIMPAEPAETRSTLTKRSRRAAAPCARVCRAGLKCSLSLWLLALLLPLALWPAAATAATTTTVSDQASCTVLQTTPPSTWSYPICRLGAYIVSTGTALTFSGVVALTDANDLIVNSGATLNMNDHAVLRTGARSHEQGHHQPERRRARHLGPRDQLWSNQCEIAPGCRQHAYQRWLRLDHGVRWFDKLHQ